MNGSRASSSVVWYPPGAFPLRFARSRSSSSTQEGKLLAQLGIDVAEDGLGAGCQFFDVLERLERRPAQPVDRQVPRAQRLDPERSSLLVLNLPRQRHHHVLDGFVKSNRVGNAIVESLAISERIFDEIGKACLMGNLDSELFHLVEQFVERFAILEPALGGKLPGFLANGAIGLFEERGHLGQGALLAAKCHRHRADDFLVLLLELGQLRLARNIGLSKQGAAIFEGAIENRHSGPWTTRNVPARRDSGFGSRSGSA